MADQIFPANLARQVSQKNTFSTREVGVNHPDTPGYIRLTDQGDIHIMADDGLGIIINYKSRSVTFLGDTIRFVTTEQEGLAWNDLFFNPNATSYAQPTFHVPTGSNVKNVFAGAENYYIPSSNPPVVPASQDMANAPNMAPQPSGTMFPSTAPPNPNSKPPPLEST